MIESTEMYNFFNAPKMSHNFQGIHHYIINLWNFMCIQYIVTGIKQNVQPVAG